MQEKKNVASSFFPLFAGQHTSSIMCCSEPRGATLENWGFDGPPQLPIEGISSVCKLV